MKHIILKISAAAILLGAASAHAQFLYCKIEGTQQGIIRTDNPVKGLEDSIPILSIASDVSVPFDAATGQAVGRRQHQPLTLVKNLDKASPLLFLMAVTNEVVKQVDCVLYRSQPTGETQPFFRIQLRNARVVEDSVSGNGAVNQGLRETVRFSYEKILLEDIPGKTSAEDEWRSQI